VKVRFALDNPRQEVKNAQYLHIEHMASKPSKQPKLPAGRKRNPSPQVKSGTVLVERGITSDGYVVYGSPAQPKRASVEKIREAVLALKAKDVAKRSGR
jgi:hypothetical protein